MAMRRNEHGVFCPESMKKKKNKKPETGSFRYLFGFSPFFLKAGHRGGQGGGIGGSCGEGSREEKAKYKKAENGDESEKQRRGSHHPARPQLTTFSSV